MAGRRPSFATTFVTLLGLGALAVATVAVALTLTASAAERIKDAERDHAAVNLLEQRLALTSLYAAEQAAAVSDLINGTDSMVASPIASQRATALETAIDEVSGLAERADSVGNESERWLVAIRTLPDPATVSDPYERLVAYQVAVDTACCTGIVPSDEHHVPALADLATVGVIPISTWDFFYMSVERTSHLGRGVPTDVSRFLDHLGTATDVSTDTPLPSNSLDAELSSLTTLGVPRDSINTLLYGDAIETLDNVVLNLTNRSSIVISMEETYAAADAAQRSIDEMVARAVATTRQRFEDTISTSEQIRLVTRIIAPMILLFLVALGFIVSHFARIRRRAAQREQDLLDARNRFMRMVSHELRTPATAISGFAEMLGTEWTSLTEAEISEFLAIIDRQSTHLTLLVEDLLTLSHLETGRLRLHMSVVNLNEAATQAISMVDDRYGIDIETTIDPTVTLLADPDRLVQILRNLVENAAKYGKTGVAVSAAVVARSCEIVVSDTGTGIPPDMADRMFKFWDRGERSGTRVRGYGMGLAIARHLARAMVGDLVYRPHQPVGSELVLSLPLGPPDVINSAEPVAAEAHN